MKKKTTSEDVSRYADMLAAMGTEPRLRIVRLLLSAHPEGLVVGEIQNELAIPPSTLSHHLEKLKNEELLMRAASILVQITKRPSTEMQDLMKCAERAAF